MVGSPNGAMTGAQSLVRSLEEVGADVVFGIPGGAILPAYDPLYDSTKVRHILVRHEQGAGRAAEGYAQATGKVGVCMATSGPGATNLVTPIADAYMDSVPIVAITGQVSRPAIGTDAFQEADIQGITLPVVKHNYLVQSVEELPRILAEAVRRGRGPAGPRVGGPQGARRAHRAAGGHHADGARRVPRLAPAAPRDARHARHSARRRGTAEGGPADRAGDPVRRPGHGVAAVLRPARRGGPRRHRPRRDLQEPQGGRRHRRRLPGRAG